MREYIRSFHIFSGNQLMKQALGCLAGGVVGFSFVILMYCIGDLHSEEFNATEFFSGFLPGFGIIVPMLTIVLLNGVFNAINPTAQGYKYFHSIADGGRHFRRALITVNALSVLLCALWSALLIPFAAWLFPEISPVVIILDSFIGLMMTGYIDFAGFSDKLIIRLAGIGFICAFLGFVMGFSVALEDDGKIPDWIFWAGMGICVAVFVGGFIYAMLNAEKKWYAKEKLTRKERKQANEQL